MQPANVTCAQCGRVVREGDGFCSGCGALISSAGAATQAVGAALPERAQLAIGGPLARGARLGTHGRYLIERRLGRGGFGEAYLARDTQLDQRHCVVKRLIPDGARDATLQQIALRNFQREAQLLISLNAPGHPNIPEIYEYLPDNQCLVMKYIAGQTLLQLLKRRTDPLPEAEALRYARDVCSALVYMHSRAPEPVMHRDLKPDNILLDPEGRIWLIDFGLAKALPAPLGPAHARATHASGTPGYAPPEQWQNAAEPRSDVYALAATLHTLLTNRPPPSDRAAIAALLQGRPILPPLRQFNPGIHPATEQLIARGTALDAAARPTAAEFLEQLDALLAQLTLPDPPAPARPPSAPGFVGRAAELRSFTQQLDQTGLAILAGPAGVGKTALAAALAGQAARADQVFWHAFHQEEGLDSLLWRLAAFLAWRGQAELWRLLHSAGPAGAAPPEVLIDYAAQLLRGQSYLLCLDDFQHVERDPLVVQLIERLRAELRPGGLRLLIATRQRPRFLAAQPSLGGLTPEDGRRLLAARGLALAGALADQLVAATAGNAQLLTLAAGALQQAADPARQIAQIAEASDIEHYLMREVDEHLTDGERAVMGAVAALLGYGGTRDAIEAVLDGEPAARALLSLSERALLTASPGAERVYGQHAIVQAFYYRLLGRRERLAMHQRAGAYYQHEARDTLQAARHYERAGASGQAAQIAIADAWGVINRGQAHGLRALLDQLSAQALDADLAIGILLARAQVGALLGEQQAARASYEAALDGLAARPDTPALRALAAQAYRGMGELLERESPQDALTWLERGLAAAGADQPLEAGAIQLRIGSVLTLQGDYAAARQACETSLRQLPPDADDWRAGALIKLGVIHCSQGDIANGTARYREALEIYERRGNTWGLIGARHNLGIEMDIAGDWAGALREYEQALELAARLGDVGHQAECRLSMGICLTKQGDFDAARAHLAACIGQAQQHQMSELEVGALASLADLQLRCADLGAAAATLDQVTSKALAINMRYQLPEIQRGWAQLYLAQGAIGAAQAAAERALAIAGELEMELDLGAGSRVLGQALLAAGRPAEALRSFADSLELLDGRDPYEAARTRMAWGRALLDAGEREAGGEQLHAAQAAFATLGARHELEQADALL